MTRKKIKRKKKIEWAFTPTLGYKIEPQFTKEEFEAIFGRLSDPIKEPSDPEKKETSA